VALIKCPECGKEVSSAAASCPSCGHPITGASQAPIQAPERKWSPGVAAVLSLVIPGAGQMYKGQIFSGLVWLFFVVIGYALYIVPGILLHLCCIFAASIGDPTK
jgi:zinc-ribbon domain